MKIPKFVKNMAVSILKQSGVITQDPFSFYKEFGSGTSTSKPFQTNATIYSVIKAIMDNVSQADYGFYDWEHNKEIYPAELMRLFRRPNPVMSWKMFLEAMTCYIALYNEVIIVKTLSVGQAAGTSKLPSELWVFNPKQFSIINNDKRNPVWQSKGTTFTSDEIIHIWNFNPYSDSQRAFSATDPIAADIDIDYQRLAFNSAFFKNGGKPAYIMSTDKSLGDNQVKQLRADWDQNFKGTSKAGRLAIFDNGLKLTDTGATHNSMQYTEQRDDTKETILGIWRVPKTIISITDQVHYATFSGQMKAFWLYTLTPMLEKITSEFNFQLVEKYDNKIEMRFKYMNVPAFQDDYKEKIDIALKLKDLLIPVNEINDKLELGFSPQKWNEDAYIGMGYIPASQYSEYMLFSEEANRDTSSDSDGKTSYIEVGKSPEDKYGRKIADMFIKRHRHFEIAFQPKISGFFYSERAKILRLVEKSEFNPDLYAWGEDKLQLEAIARPMLEKMLKDGVAFGAELIPPSKGLIHTKEIDDQISRYLQIRADKITRIVDTVERQIRTRVQELTSAGASINEIAQAVRQIYNMAAARSMTIARTETTGAINNGTWLYWSDAGIYGKRWLSYNDGNTRKTHKEAGGQVVPINDKFFVGGIYLMYPGDQDADAADEIVNCRCDIAPVAQKPR